MTLAKYLVTIFNYVNLTNDVVTCGTPESFHHGLVIINIKSRRLNYVATTMVNAFSQWWDDMYCNLIGFGVD